MQKNERVANKKNKLYAAVLKSVSPSSDYFPIFEMSL